MPDVTLATSGLLNSSRAGSSGVRQSTNEVLMVAPTAFGFNDQVSTNLKNSTITTCCSSSDLDRRQDLTLSWIVSAMVISVCHPSACYDATRGSYEAQMVARRVCASRAGGTRRTWLTGL